MSIRFINVTTLCVHPFHRLPSNKSYRRRFAYNYVQHAVWPGAAETYHLRNVCRKWEKMLFKEHSVHGVHSFSKRKYIFQMKLMIFCVAKQWKRRYNVVNQKRLKVNDKRDSREDETTSENEMKRDHNSIQIQIAVVRGGIRLESCQMSNHNHHHRKWYKSYFASTINQMALMMMAVVVHWRSRNMLILCRFTWCVYSLFVRRALVPAISSFQILLFFVIFL